ncbi:MAG: dipeptidase PepE [Flavobacteriales bacterium]|nr:dipeptidase PepE [Flavobacteriales bacterium]MBK9287261.1 dipeptidase PepE [Flavobacteriales bacterium]MBL0034322.1 dipeptidase PepE [Flavobacteriales bacterium]
MDLLLLSNSTLPGEPFLQWPRQAITDFLGAEQRRIAFVPFAAVSFSMDEYTRMVQGAFAEMGHELFSLHTEPDKVKALETADAVVVGGGNSFQLLRTLYSTELIRAVRRRVQGGLPYIGWSAGSNVACPSIMTTNDMPITEVPTLRAMGLIPYQINPHYTDVKLDGHGGETRDQRLNEFLALNQRITVVGLREGSGLRVHNDRTELIGRAMRLFRHGSEPLEVAEGSAFRSDLSDVK